MTNIPVLTGKVAEDFIKQCEYNSKYLAGSEWSQEDEDWFNKIMLNQEKNFAAVEAKLNKLAKSTQMKMLHSV